jgi:hypothetical protein
MRQVVTLLPLWKYFVSGSLPSRPMNRCWLARSNDAISSFMVVL